MGDVVHGEVHFAYFDPDPRWWQLVSIRDGTYKQDLDFRNLATDRISTVWAWRGFALFELVVVPAAVAQEAAAASYKP